MQFIDLMEQQKRIREKIDANITAVLDHGKYILGPEVQELEEKLAEFAGVKHAMGCSSGTDALLLALMAHGVGPGDAVFTTPFTFIATAEVISLIGAVPVFVDADPATFNLDAKQLKNAVNALKTGSGDYPLPAVCGDTRLTPKGIIPVDMFGLPADYTAVESVAQENGLFVIEDGAQSFGGEYQGKKACSLADVGCTSFYPAKPLGCYGDGGMCFTDSDSLAGAIRSLTVHGQGGDKYDNVRIGINGRLDSIQAAVLLAKFEIFSEEINLRRQAADRYSEGIDDSAGVVTPFVPEGSASAWAQYSILAKDEKHRADIQAKLKGNGIPTVIYYPGALHLQPAFESLGYSEGAFPKCEELTARIFSLPMHPYITPDEQEEVVTVINAGV